MSYVHRERVRRAGVMRTAVQLVTEWLEEYHGEWPNTPEEINSGECEDFAEELRSRLDTLGYEGVLVLRDDPEVRDWNGAWDLWTHAWVVVDGRCYDSEAPSGVSRWTQLPFFRRLALEGLRVEGVRDAEGELEWLRANSQFMALASRSLREGLDSRHACVFESAGAGFARRVRSPRRVDPGDLGA